MSGLTDCRDPELLAKKLGINIDLKLLELALTHRSYAHEAGVETNNERLEFLGDSVVGIVVTEWLFRRHPGVSEGTLAKMRAATVSREALAIVGRAIDLGDYIKLGRGERLTGGRDKDSILCDTFEAVIGAIYLGNGLEYTRELVVRLTGDLLAQAGTRRAGQDWKTAVNVLAKNSGLGEVSYEVTHEGPDHDRVFSATLLVDGKAYETGRAPSRKAAEKQAAALSYPLLETAAGAGEDA